MMHALRDASLPLVARLVPRPKDRQSNSILVIQPDHLGDILLSQPAVRHIRSILPEAQLTAVVGPWSAEIARIAWPVDEVLTINFPGFTRSAGSRRLDPYLQLRREQRTLRGCNAESAVVLRSDAWWAAWLAALAVPRVVGSDDRRVQPFTTETVTLPGRSHAAVRSLTLAHALTESPDPGDEPITFADAPLRIRVNDEARVQAEALRRKYGVTGPYAVIHPGSGAPVKEWPENRWRIVIAALLQVGLTVFITGSKAERAKADAIAFELSGAYVIAGETPLPILAEVLRGASIVLGPDSGPLHLAVACDTPTVHLFGPSDPVRYGPWGDPARHRVVRSTMRCSRCGDLSLSRPAGCGCMLAVTPEAVLAAVHGRPSCA
jgi:heptosyltransferase III